MTRAENNILLISITLCWAASYLFIKELPEDFSSFAYLTLTTGIAALIMAAIFWKKLFRFKADTWGRGFLLSLFLSASLLAEKEGISRLAPPNASFLASLTIILVPLLLFVSGRRPTLSQAVGAAVILAGLCVGTGFELRGFYSAGSLYMLASCLCSAVYTCLVDRYAKEKDPLGLCMVQLIFTSAIGYLLWFQENPATFRSVMYTKELLSCILILAFFAKAYAYIVLLFSQKYTDAVSVTVISATEPVITLALSALLPASYGGSRKAGVLPVAGAVIIATGAVIAGLHFSDGVPNTDLRKG